MKFKNKLAASAVFASIVVSGAAIADDSFTYNGYFRAGANTALDGGTVDGGSCYALAHPSNDGLYYRLGNECRDFAEFSFTKKGEVNGLNYKAVGVLDLASSSTSSTATADFSRRERQLYLEFDNLFDNGAKLWAGRRYYRAVAVGDIHIIDAFHVSSSGNGFGVTDIPVGADSKLHLAAMHAGDSDVSNIMLDGRLDVGLGNAGRLKFALQNVIPREADGIDDATGGTSLTLQWDKNIGGFFDQKTVVQFGKDALGNNPGCWGSDGVGNGNCYDNSPEADGLDGTRIFNNGMWNFSDRFKVNTMFMVEDVDGVREATSIGLRPHYSLSKHISLLAEISKDEIQMEGKAAEKLDKVTLALQVSGDSKNFWSRPAIRFYVSKFNWNEAARDGDSGLRVVNSDQTDSTLIGVQGEIWF